MARKKKRAPLPIKRMMGMLTALTLAFMVLVPLNAATGAQLPLPSTAQVSEVLTQLYDKAGIEVAPAPVNADVTVHYIDVGQGDCELIRTREQAVLIDAGDAKNGSVVVDYLRAQGIKRIDMLIATHPHADHIGGMAAVIKSFEVGKIIFSEVPEKLIPTTKTYENLLDTIAAKGLFLTKARPGMQYNLGDDAMLTILGPLKTHDKDLNEASVVCRLAFGKTSFLFTGDASTLSESDLIAEYGTALSSTALKLGHHGSDTSTQERWLNAVQPQFAIACVGADNTYGHPSVKILQRLDDREIELQRTDRSGTVVLVTDGTAVALATEKQRGIA